MHSPTVLTLSASPRDSEMVQSIQRFRRCPKPGEEQPPVVMKPWGCEYSLFDTDKCSLWVLHMSPGSSTSQHAHLTKDAEMLVISGELTLSTLEGEVKVSPGDIVRIERGVFHSIANSADGSEELVLFELESPRDRYDIIRYKDRYGREGHGYDDSFVPRPENVQSQLFLGSHAIYGPYVVSAVCEPERVECTLNSFQFEEGSVIVYTGTGVCLRIASSSN